MDRLKSGEKAQDGELAPLQYRFQSQGTTLYHIKGEAVVYHSKVGRNDIRSGPFSPLGPRSTSLPWSAAHSIAVVIGPTGTHT